MVNLANEQAIDEYLFNLHFDEMNDEQYEQYMKEEEYRRAKHEEEQEAKRQWLLEESAF